MPQFINTIYYLKVQNLQKKKRKKVFQLNNLN